MKAKKIYLKQQGNDIQVGISYKVTKLVNAIEPRIDTNLTEKQVKELMFSPNTTVYISAK